METDGYVRRAVEAVIKEQGLDRSRIFEADKLHYAAIIQKIQETFVQDGGDIHWANMGYFRPQVAAWSILTGDRRLWYHEHELTELVPKPQERVYVLLEDTQDFEPKYWLYEMYLPELIIILDETVGLDDFYIISKKMDWLITENHEEIVTLAGEALRIAAMRLQGDD